MKILSLFDGMSCGQQALERAGIKVDKYFASEIDKHAIKVTQHNYPNTIQLGSVTDVDTSKLPPIDLLCGGSPCTNFSFAGKMKGMVTTDNQEVTTLERYLELKEQGYQFEGQSYLFWEYVRILQEVKPKWFLLENVPMTENWRKILSVTLGVNEIRINSNLVSAQNRERWYWTNIGMQSAGLFGDMVSIIQQPKDKGILLKDILQPLKEVDSKYFLSEKMISYLLGAKRAVDPVTEDTKKYNTLTSVYYKTPTDGQYLKKVSQINPSTESGGKQPYQQNRVYDSEGISPALCSNKSDLLVLQSTIRKLTPIECERLQTVSDNYTSGVSDSQRYKMLGNGWTIDVIAHIFSYLLK